MIRVPVEPHVLRWACERSGIPPAQLTSRFPKLPEWTRGEAQPTLKQLEAFSRTVHAPLGHLFGSEPPEETLPIPDFRTLPGRPVRRPSPNLLETIYTCQERQGWYRGFARVSDQPDLDFVGSATLETSPAFVAAEMRERLGFDLAARRRCPTWAEAARRFSRQVDDAGILVMVSGIVGSNTRRILDPAEFRGFALSDPLAPLIFVNGRDARAAQMFTLAHELAHLWLGESALTSLGVAPEPGYRREEAWCNAVAAEFLVPLATLRHDLRRDEPLPAAVSRLRRAYKVSSLVILRRLLEAGWISRARFRVAWAEEIRRQGSQTPSTGRGGDFHRTTISRVGRRFARALVVSTLEGQTLYRDAFRMLGVRKAATFDRLAREAGVPA